MSREELDALEAKGRLFRVLNPEVSGLCKFCLHLDDLEWCKTNPRVTCNTATGIAMETTGLLAVGHICLEWVKHV